MMKWTIPGRLTDDDDDGGDHDGDGGDGDGDHDGDVGGHDGDHDGDGGDVDDFTLHTGLVCTSFGSFGSTVYIAASPGTLLVLPILILLFLLVPHLSVLILIFLILLYIFPKHC